MFDFGGVIAEEGFKSGLYAIAQNAGMDKDSFYKTAEELIFTGGYVTGMTDEADFWSELGNLTGIRASDNAMRVEILKRFTLRPGVLEYADRAKTNGLITGILSDQTNWLEELDGQYKFFSRFDYVFNSFRIHKSKRDPSVFSDAARIMAVEPSEVLFIDDNPANCQRAASVGMATINYTGMDSLREGMKRMIGI